MVDPLATGPLLRHRLLRVLFWLDLFALLAVFASQFNPPIWTAWEPSEYRYVVAHVTLASLMATLWFLERGQKTLARWITAALFATGFAIGGYYFYTESLELLFRSSYGSTPDLVIGSLVAVQTLYLVWRLWGAPVAALGVIFFLLMLYADDLPGSLRGPSLDFHNVLTRLVSQQLFGSLAGTGTGTGTGAVVLWPLVFWGVLLSAVGGPPMASMLSAGLRRLRLAGAPALAAVGITSAVGSVSGGGAANVFISGPITIPMLRRKGYAAPYAASIEAIAASGGAITPPILGAVAFIMADITGVSYLDILLMSLAPAGLWFLSLGVFIYANAHMSTPAAEVSPSDEPRGNWGAIMVFVAPIGVLIGAQFHQTLPASIGWALVTLLVVTLAVARDRFISEMPNALYRAAFYASAMTLLLVVFDVVQGSMIFTGFSLRLSLAVEDWASGSLLGVVLIATAFGLVLGGALPAVAVFIIMVLTFSATFASLGVDFTSAVYIAFFAGTLSTVIPPIALGTIIASMVAGTDYWSTTRSVVRILWPVLLFPAMFAVSPELITQAGTALYLQVGVIVGTAVVVAGVQAANAGWLLGTVSPPVRVALILNYGLLITALHMDLWVLGFVAVAVVIAGAATTRLAAARTPTPTVTA